MLIELDAVDRITTDAVGPPGERTFFIQGRKDDRLVTILVEKQQVQLLAASVVEILARVGSETAEGPGEEEMGLEEPVIPEWRAGRLSIGYEEERDLIVLEAEELLPDEEEDDDEDDEDDEDLGPNLDLALGVPEPRLRPRDGETEGEGPGELEEAEAGLGGGPGSREPGRVRFWATREQMLSLARHGAAVCARGRPRCRLCGNPMEPEGHLCPALNGHGGGER